MSEAKVENKPENKNETTRKPPSTAAQNKPEKDKDSVDYNSMVDQMARGLYNVFPKAEFTVDTLSRMNDMRRLNAPFDNLPTKVKLCLIKLAMAILPTPDVLKEQEAEEKPAESDKK